jgi:NitT/TauT family transport system permease protein
MKRFFIPVLFLLGLTVLFELVLRAVNVSQYILPRPSLVLQALAANWQWIVTNLGFTLYEALVGFGLSLILGIGLALLYLFVPSLENIIVPLAIAVRNVPFVAIVPILFMTLGYGPEPKIIIVMVVSFFPIMANLSAGFASVNQNQLERFFVLRATKWQLFTKLQLPTAVPYLVTGLEIAVSNIVIAAIVGELLGTTKGLGFVIVMSVSQYRFSLLMAAVVVTTVASILVTWIIKACNKILLRKWLPQESIK